MFLTYSENQSVKQDCKSQYSERILRPTPFSPFRFPLQNVPLTSIHIHPIRRQLVRGLYRLIGRLKEARMLSPYVSKSQS